MATMLSAVAVRAREPAVGLSAPVSIDSLVGLVAAVAVVLALPRGVVAELDGAGDA